LTITPGTKLGAYETLAPLGAGGMGEVYRGRDTRLDRAVAIKVLPADFANDADRLKRFEQEARATSALNHPNILTIYDIGTHEGAPYIVAELLEGEELRVQLDDGALPVRKALEYAQQVAAGLAAAHEKGIVHRDLKPENLFVTKDGRVKILDFGLAKLKPQKLAGGVGSQAPTLKPPDRLTDPGVVMGTVGYMSPEQVRGQEADHRSDIFSFGMILYEMLSGKPVFSGVSVADVMSAILKEDPPELSETNVKISPALDKIVRRCLEKKPEHRFHSAHDLGFALSTVTTPSGSRLETATALPALTESSPATGKAGLFGNARVPWITALVAVLALLAALPFAVKYLRQSPPADAVAMRFTVAAPEKTISIRAPEISPDGRHLVFTAFTDGKWSLWLRPLGALKAQPLPGTDDVGGLGGWSPDSRSLLIYGRDATLKKIDVAGGPPQTLCNFPDGRPDNVSKSTWSRDGVILFVASGVIYRVAATGGEPTPVLGTKGEREEPSGYRSPVFLPDGRHFLFLKLNRQPGTSEIYLASLDGAQPIRLLAAESQAVYTAPTSTTAGSGHLIFARGGFLLAQPFDAGSLQLTGEPVRVADQLEVVRDGRGFFSASDNGSLVYASSSALYNQQLTWIDRTGRPLEPVGPPGMYESPRLSPDGKQVAVTRMDPNTRTQDIYVIDLARGASSRLTLDPADDRYAIWSPDGSRIVWAHQEENSHQFRQKLASGVGQEEVLFKSDAPVAQGSWSPDGRFILYTRSSPKTRSDLYILPLEGDRQPFAFLETPFVEASGRFSPDGRWIAYHSNDQGRDEVYVQPFPASGAKWQISTTVGSQPQWRGDGKELFYMSGDNKLLAVEVKPGSSFAAGVPKALFDLAPLRMVTSNRSFAVTADGQRFLVVTQRQEAANVQYTVVVNWAAEAKQ
jgi:Tol biopolymer transport system component